MKKWLILTAATASLISALTAQAEAPQQCFIDVDGKNYTAEQAERALKMAFNAHNDTYPHYLALVNGVPAYMGSSSKYLNTNYATRFHMRVDPQSCLVTAQAILSVPEDQIESLNESPVLRMEIDGQIINVTATLEKLVSAVDAQIAALPETDVEEDLSFRDCVEETALLEQDRKGWARFNPFADKGHKIEDEQAFSGHTHCIGEAIENTVLKPAIRDVSKVAVPAVAPEVQELRTELQRLSSNIREMNTALEGVDWTQVREGLAMLEQAGAVREKMAAANSLRVAMDFDVPYAVTQKAVREFRPDT